jgi:hypothetical protein
MNNLLMPQPGVPQPPTQTPAPSAEEIAQSRKDVANLTKHLMALAAMPKGSLSKEAVYNAAADMIADGAFGTPQAKQGLVAELAQLPDSEPAIRAVIGQHLMFLAHAQDRIHATFGPEEQPNA